MGRSKRKRLATNVDPIWIRGIVRQPTNFYGGRLLTLNVLNSSGGSLATLHTWSNLSASIGYTQQSFDLTACTRQTVTIKIASGPKTSACRHRSYRQR